MVMKQSIIILFILKIFTFLSIALRSTTFQIMHKVPKLIAFDLDGTVWSPDMYELWSSGGAPFKKISSKKLVDRGGTTVKLIGVIGEILHELHTDDRWDTTKVAWVSCTDEPSWADECLNKFDTTGGTPLIETAHSSQIFKSNKQVHFKKLQVEFGFDFSEMLFFDNEYRNIETVSKLGVKCMYESYHVFIICMH